MEDIETILEQIPIRHNLASHIMLLGIVQGLFLVLVIFLRTKRDSAIQLFGWALLVQCLVFMDIYLCYTGLMKHVLFLNDSTEAFVLLIAPTLYFFLYSLLKREPFKLKKQWYHFILPIAYGLSQINYSLSPLEVKLNAYIGAYHRNLSFVDVPDSVNYSYHIIKDQFRWILLFSFAFYLILSIQLVAPTWRTKEMSAKNIKVNKYTFSRNTVFFFLVLLLFIFLIFINYDDDGGDHYIGIFGTITIFVTSFFIFSESRFFEKTWIADKYETLSSNSLEFGAVEDFLNHGAYYCHQDISLKDLAENLNTNANTVSKLINSETGMNFNDFINQKRILLAKTRLLDNEFAHLTVEAIGHTVGFRSKSAFYSAFKKHVGSSPSSYMKQKRG
ncbi:helix-turn-helix transcriptional regulator [Muricauda sp. CAU 1633]|uniref:helix-turn-helix domain-containing protein n=1 Tax=Allomuricauda sp. CAU 1633 TaxID=2816036 RepID=UPI001A8D1855|nr:AraC family transcriptional regulator [Muricauda sp. CAU 1633]MBO0321361.1 helix-turn-helix transcriptional regulator [Muricauda sp. CAU 1633]